MAGKKLPADHAIDALVAEVERRRRLSGYRGYSYGKLIADTTEEERREIVKRYRRREIRKVVERMMDYDSHQDQEDAAAVAKKLVDRERKASGD